MPKEVTPRPNIIWRLFVLGGLGSMVAVSIDDNAWEAADELAGGAIDRDAVRAGTAAMLGLHVLEALFAWRSARRGGLERPGRWARATLLWGFPVLRRIRKAKRMEIAA